MKKKIALLMLVPIVSFVLLPVATVNATVPHYSLQVECYGEAQIAGVSLSFLGHSVIVNCPSENPANESGEPFNDVYMCISSSHGGTFKVISYVGSVHATTSGPMSQSQGEASGEQYGPAFSDSSAIYWYIWPGCG